MRKRLIVAATTVVVMSFGFWLAGVDFSKRGTVQSMSFFVMVGVSLLTGLLVENNDKEGGGK